MTIKTLDQYIGSAKQKIPLMKIATRTSVGTLASSVFDVAGNPGPGVLAGASTSPGVMPTDATPGHPPINFSTGTGYLASVEFGNSVASRLAIFDLLWKGGAYSYAAGTTEVTSAPNISARCPDYAGGAAFGGGNEVWIEVCTAFAAGTAWQVQVTYTNQDGVAGRTGTISSASAANLILGRMMQLGLQSGDSGVQAIESVVVTDAGTPTTSGAFNVLIMRRLWSASIMATNVGDVHGLDRTGMPVVYPDSALFLVVTPNGSSTGSPELLIEVANG